MSRRDGGNRRGEEGGKTKKTSKEERKKRRGANARDSPCLFPFFLFFWGENQSAADFQHRPPPAPPHRPDNGVSVRRGEIRRPGPLSAGEGGTAGGEEIDGARGKQIKRWKEMGAGAQ